jgi:hypothetical protein
MKELQTKSLALALALTITALGLSFGTGALADGGSSGQFASCVQTNGGTLPNLTAEQKTAKKDCWMNNQGDHDKAKQCIQALNLPQPDSKTEAAIKTCRANWKKNQSNG